MIVCPLHEQRMFDVCSISADATGVEVFSLATTETVISHILIKTSPNPRSHEVWRMSALRDRSQTSWPCGECSALPHNPRK